VPATILVTGGLGYIGSHTCVALAQAGYRLLIVDNLSNSRRSVLARLRELCGAEPEFHEADVRDAAALDRALSGRPVRAAIHFAALKAVGESVERPLDYYENNVCGSLSLLRALERHGVTDFVFSSSATVYGEPERLPLTEAHRIAPQNPYGHTKAIVEQILLDKSGAQADFRHAILRYFNPIGAHPSGRLGEDPRGIPNNLLPYVAQVAIGRLPRLRVFGNDYPTPDGTGVRDYLHVCDLAAGHLAALQYLEHKRRSLVVNLGTGRGYSVLETVKAFERASGKKVPLEFAARRAGDSAACYADASLAARELDWRARLTLEDMCRDAWRWQSSHPHGFPD
jgi:UDP-glucose 4-epimerase